MYISDSTWYLLHVKLALYCVIPISDITWNLGHVTLALAIYNWQQPYKIGCIYSNITWSYCHVKSAIYIYCQFYMIHRPCKIGSYFRVLYFRCYMDFLSCRIGINHVELALNRMQKSLYCRYYMLPLPCNISITYVISILPILNRFWKLMTPPPPPTTTTTTMQQQQRTTTLSAWLVWK